MMTRRRMLAVSASALPLTAAGDGPVVKLGFDGALDNAGAWGGAVRRLGAASTDPVMVRRGARGVADLTCDWVQQQGGRLIYEDARVGAMNAFSVALSFHPLRIGPGSMTLVQRLGQWRVGIGGSGQVQAVLQHDAVHSQTLQLVTVRHPETWYQVALSVDPQKQKLQFLFRRVGGAWSEASYNLLPDVLGPATDHSRRILDIGSGVAGERFYGYIDELALWDRVLAPEQLRAALEAAQPSFGELGLPPAAELLYPSAPDRGVALPHRSDVCLSSRWWHPRGAKDANDTLRDTAAFGATRLEWVYDFDAAHIDQVKQRGMRWISTINGNDESPGRTMAMRDFDGNPAVYPHMATWKVRDGLPPAAACINNPAFYEFQCKLIQTALTRGADGIQYDDWGSNCYLPGECLCRHCLEGFPKFLNDAAFDYKAYLRGKHKVASQADYLRYVRARPADAMAQAYTRYQTTLVRTFLERLQAVLKAARTRDGKKPTLAMNCALYSGSQQRLQYACADLADYCVFEGPDESVAGVTMYARLAESLGKTNVISPFPFETGAARSTIALSYALGQLCLVPYDIWMHQVELPRYFGTTAQYGDLFAFVRANAGLFDQSQSVATVAVAFDVAKPQPDGLRGVLETLVEAGVPFVFAPLGRLYHEVPLDKGWREGVPYVIDLSERDDVAARFPNARRLRVPLSAADLKRIAVVRVEAPSVVATVRGAASHMAVHLVNRNFDAAGEVTPIEQFGVRLARGEFWGRVKSAELLAPGQPPRQLEVRAAGRDQRVVVPRLDTWGVVRVAV